MVIYDWHSSLVWCSTSLVGSLVGVNSFGTTMSCLQKTRQRLGLYNISVRRAPKHRLRRQTVWPCWVPSFGTPYTRSLTGVELVAAASQLCLLSSFFVLTPEKWQIQSADTSSEDLSFDHHPFLVRTASRPCCYNFVHLQSWGIMKPPSSARWHNWLLVPISMDDPERYSSTTWDLVFMSRYSALK